jgi:g-D-glutamyl-meso-diaminopimelate peptidase
LDFYRYLGENQTVPLYLASEGYKLWHQRYPIEKADTEIQLFAAANLYHRPSESYPTGGQISAGKVMSDARVSGIGFHRGWGRIGFD